MLLPCGNYIATFTASELCIYNVSNKSEHRRYSVTDILLVVWEHVKEEKCLKIACVVAKGVFVFDFRETDPIIIELNEGVDTIEWIVPLEELEVVKFQAKGVPNALNKLLGSEGNSKEAKKLDQSMLEGYRNSKQLVIFTPLGLYARIYSLDCTHILFTILKPLSHIISRPNFPNWSIVVEPVEFNSRPIIYTFANKGSRSQLLHATSYGGGEILWSSSGKWLSSSATEFSVFGLLGPEIFRATQDGPGSWLTISGEDLFIVVSSDALVVSTNLLRVNRQRLLIPRTSYIYSRGDYRKMKAVKQVVSKDIHKLHTLTTSVIIQYKYSVLVYRLENYRLVPQCSIMCQPKLVKLYETHQGNEILIVCNDHIIRYSGGDNFKVVFRGSNIVTAYIIIDAKQEDELIVQFDGGEIDNWTRIILGSKGKNRLWDTSIEVTDTFLKKRNKLGR